MANCRSCGKELSEQVQFCGGCEIKSPLAAPSPGIVGFVVTLLKMPFILAKLVLTAKSRWIRFGVPGIFALMVIGALIAPTQDQPAHKELAAGTPAASPQITEQEKLRARAALCDAVSRELPDVQAGTQSKDKFPVILAEQLIGEGPSARAAVRAALTDYRQGKWSEKDCPDYAALPEGAIDLCVVKTTAWWYPSP